MLGVVKGIGRGLVGVVGLRGWTWVSRRGVEMGV